MSAIGVLNKFNVTFQEVFDAFFSIKDPDEMVAFMEKGRNRWGNDFNYNIEFVLGERDWHIREAYHKLMRGETPEWHDWLGREEILDMLLNPAKYAQSSGGGE